MKRYAVLMVAAMFAASYVSADFIEGGRTMPGDRGVRISAEIGTVTKIQGLVEETHRNLYDVTGSYWKQDDAESYNLNDLGMDDSYPAIGLEIEDYGTWISFLCNVMIMSPSVNTVARRNYYLGVGDEIEYGGRSYSNMKIPSGTPFSMDLVGVMLDPRFAFTPFTITPTESLRFTPWLDLGLMAFIGQYDLDAGPVTGTATYQNPPVQFAVGGQSSGLIAMALPEWGGGGELRIGEPGGFNVVLQGNYAVCDLSGSTKFITSSRHREKNADIEHKNIFARLFLEFPFGKDNAFTLGVHYQRIDSEALISSTATDPDVILAMQERFDKYVEFHLETTMVMVGVTF